MAAFTDDDIHALDWTFFRDEPVVLYHDQGIMRNDVRWLEDHQYKTKSFDCSAWYTMNDFHKDISSS